MVHPPKPAFLSSCLATGLSLGVIDGGRLIMAAGPAAPEAVALAVAQAVFLSLALGSVLSLGARVGQPSPQQARLRIVLMLWAPWSAVAIGLGQGAGIAGSPWRWPLVVVLVGAGGLGLWFLVWMTTLRQRWLSLSGYALVSALLYGTGFVFRESYAWLHVYFLVLGLTSLLAFFALVLPVPNRVQNAASAGALLLMLVTAILLPSSDTARYQLYVRTQGARSLMIAKAYLGLTGSHDSELLLAMQSGSREEQFTLPVCPEQSAKDMDIVLLTIDAMRADRLFASGHPVMPSLEALAKDGSFFASAYAPSPETSTSLVSILSGRSALALRDPKWASADEVTHWPSTLATQLSRLGYHTTSFFPFNTVTQRLLPKADARKLGFKDIHKSRKAPEVIASLIEELSKRGPRPPAFYYAHLLEPHSPYQAHTGHEFGRDMVGRYDSELAHVDAQIGKLVVALRAMGRLDNTIIAISADHGEAFFEHGVMAHGSTLYEEMIRVPLVLRIPGLRSEPIEAPVSLLDLAPTIMAAIGCGWKGRTEGQSLLRDGVMASWGEAVIVRQYQTSEKGARFVRREATRSGQDKLIIDLHTDIAELYDLGDDPGEENNRVDARAERRASLMDTILEERRAIGAVLAGDSQEGLAALASEIVGGDLASVQQAQEQLLAVHQSSEEALEVVRALEACPDQSADKVLATLSTESDLPDALADAITLAQAGRGRPWPALALVLFVSSERPAAVRRQAIETLGNQYAEMIPRYQELASADPELEVAAAAALALCSYSGHEEQAAAYFRKRVTAIKSMHKVGARLASRAVSCLARSGTDLDAAFLVNLHRSGVAKKMHVAYDNIAAMGMTHNDIVLPLLSELTVAGYEAIRFAGLDALAELGTEGSRDKLLALAAQNRHLKQAPEHFLALVQEQGKLERLGVARSDDAVTSLVGGKTSSSARLVLLEFGAPTEGFSLSTDGVTRVLLAPEIFKRGESLTVFLSWSAGMVIQASSPSAWSSLRSIQLLSTQR